MSVPGTSVVYNPFRDTLSQVPSMSFRFFAAVRTPKRLDCRPVDVALVLATLICASCQPVEQGFWAKPGVVGPEATIESDADSRQCARLGAEQATTERVSGDGTVVAHDPAPSMTGPNAYSQCMRSRGYEWVRLKPLVGPAPHHATTTQAPCPTGRIVVDPFGYPHCAGAAQGQSTFIPDGLPESVSPTHVPAATAQPGSPAPTESPAHDNVQSDPSPADRTAVPSDIRPSSPELPKNERQAVDQSECIQHSQNSLSNPYDTFRQCMTEKGWPTQPE